MYIHRAKLIVAVDFDGTLVEHAYPEIGPDTGGCYWIHRCQQEHGARIILWTMRDDDELDAAIKYCEDRGIRFWGVNTNPEQDEWTDSRKVYAHVYVDDAALGTPLTFVDGRRPFVDWNAVGPALLNLARMQAEEEEKQS